MNEIATGIGTWMVNLWHITPGWVISTIIILIALHSVAHWIKDRVYESIGYTMRHEFKEQRRLSADSIAGEIENARNEFKLDIEESVRRELKRSD